LNIAFFSFNQWKIPLTIINELALKYNEDHDVHILSWHARLFRDPGYLNSNLLQKLLLYRERIEIIFCNLLHSNVSYKSSNLFVNRLKLKAALIDTLKNIKVFDVQNVINLHYDGFSFGNAIVSSLGTHFGFAINDKSKFSRFTIKKMTRSYLKVYLAAEEYITANKIESVYIFNGRFLHDCAVLNVCKKLNVPFYIYEISDDHNYYYVSKNSTLFDSKNLINFMIDSSSLSQDSSIDLKTWFSSKVNVYFQNSPNDVELTEKLALLGEFIVFFASSMDESIYLEENIDSVYPDQSSSILDLAIILRTQFPNLKLVVRSHPRMTQRPKTELDHWERFVDFVIKPDLHIKSNHTFSSYELISLAKFVSIYKSSIGLESSYLGKKPLILGQNTYSVLPGLVSIKDRNSISEFLTGSGKSETLEGLILYLRYFQETKIAFNSPIVNIDSSQIFRSALLKYESYVFLKFHRILHKMANFLSIK